MTTTYKSLVTGRTVTLVDATGAPQVFVFGAWLRAMFLTGVR